MEVPLKAGDHAFEKSAGSWKATIVAEKLIENTYADRLVQTRKDPSYAPRRRRDYRRPTR